MRRLSASVLTVALAASLPGCLVGPSYRRPAVMSPDRFYGGPASPSLASLADERWWDVFSDPALRSLIDEALRNGFDVRLASARVEEARARYGIAGSYAFPTVSASGSAQRGHTSTYASPSDSTGSLFVASVPVSWELDVWGRIRRLNEAARAQYLSTEEARAAVSLSLVSEVATAYFELRELDEELEIARHTRTAFQDTFDLFSRRLEGGAASGLETARAESLLANASAQIPLLERRIVAKENQLTLLAGRSPGPVARGTALAEQPIPPGVPAGLPSSLLERRPDLRRAEQDLVASNANVGAAHAALFPALSLTGLLGAQSPQLSDFLSAGKAWSLGASVLGPIFSGGRLRAQERVARAQFEAARVSYEQAVTRALGEVSTSLVSMEKLAEEEKARVRALGATRNSVRLATIRYQSGLSAYFEVLDALQQLLTSETALAQTRRDRLVALAGFYKVAGGGWELTESAGSPAAP